MPAPITEELREMKHQEARLRAAYDHLDCHRDRFPTQQGQSRLLRRAMRHAERRSATLRETSLARRALAASWELATFRYVRYSEGFRRWRKDVMVRS